MALWELNKILLAKRFDNEEEITMYQGKLDNFVVKQEKGRYKFYEIELSHIIEFPKQLN